MFVLDLRLEQDTLPLGDFPLCRLLLMNDAHYLWFILVPRREEISELFQLIRSTSRRCGEKPLRWPKPSRIPSVRTK